MKKNRKRKAIGRILSAKLMTATAELINGTDVEEGSIVCFMRSGKQFIGRIDTLETKKYAGLIAYIRWLDPINIPPKGHQEIFLADDDTEDGIFLIGTDKRGFEVRLDLNPIYMHLMICGMTQQGKTHLALILLEEMIPRGVPSLVIDTHGEFVNLAKTYGDKVAVVGELRFEDLIPHLQQRRTVVYNLLGLPKVSKANRVGEILSQLMEAKEKDYAQAENNELLLQIPPVIVIVDEAELYAPNKNSRYGARSDALDTLITIAKEGAKFGLGLVVLPQRITKLDIDVRGECNSAAIFKAVDAGTRNAIRNLDFITTSDMKGIRSFTQGICLLAGSFVKRPRIVMTRELITEKVKKIDFETMLGVEADERIQEEYVPQFVRQGADIVDPGTEEVVETAIESLRREDVAAFAQEEGDGVVLRSHISAEDQKVLQELRKPNKKGDRLIG